MYTAAITKALFRGRESKCAAAGPPVIENHTVDLATDRVGTKAAPAKHGGVPAVRRLALHAGRLAGGRHRAAALHHAGRPDYSHLLLSVSPRRVLLRSGEQSLATAVARGRDREREAGTELV